MNDTLENIFISTESFDSETLQTDPETPPDKHLSLNDEDIVALFFARDEGAIATAREKYGRLCQSIAENIVSSREAAEECVNDALFNAWKAIPPDKPLSLRAYLGAITRRLALNRLRAETRQKRGGEQVRVCLDQLDELRDFASMSHGWDTENDAREQLRDLLNLWLSKEPILPRKIFLWRYWYAYSIEDVAQLAGKSEGAVKMSLSRSKKRLQAFLNKEGFMV